jgi:hypothetical protein
MASPPEHYFVLYDFSTIDEFLSWFHSAPSVGQLLIGAALMAPFPHGESRSVPVNLKKEG